MRASGGRPPMKPRPLQISDDGHDRSLFSRQRDIIMNQVLGISRVKSGKANMVAGIEPND